jgi:transposase
MAGIQYRLRTGCQWDAIPKEFGSGSTCYRRFVEWRKAGVFYMMHMYAFDERRRDEPGTNGYLMRHGATVSARDLGRASRALARERTNSSRIRDGARAEGGPTAALGLAV